MKPITLIAVAVSAFACGMAAGSSMTFRKDAEWVRITRERADSANAHVEQARLQMRILMALCR